MKLAEAAKTGDTAGWLDANFGGKWWRVVYALGAALFAVGAVIGDSWQLRAVCVLFLLLPGPFGQRRAEQK